MNSAETITEYRAFVGVTIDADPGVLIQEFERDGSRETYTGWDPASIYDDRFDSDNPVDWTALLAEAHWEVVGDWVNSGDQYIAIVKPLDGAFAAYPWMSQTADGAWSPHRHETRVNWIGQPPLPPEFRPGDGFTIITGSPDA